MDSNFFKVIAFVAATIFIYMALSAIFFIIKVASVVAVAALGTIGTKKVLDFMAHNKINF